MLTVLASWRGGSESIGFVASTSFHGETRQAGSLPAEEQRSAETSSDCLHGHILSDSLSSCAESLGIHASESGAEALHSCCCHAFCKFLTVSTCRLKEVLSQMRGDKRGGEKGPGLTVRCLLRGGFKDSC